MAFNRLRHSSWRFRYNSGDRKKLLRDPELFLVAIIREQIVGTVLGGFDGRRGMVYHLAVSQFFRNNGIGEKLMAELETRFQLKDCLRSYLLVTRQNL
jgi:ribosomal protein S18 acetylase RimI-like enzyme